jgi:hypothetical protein
MIEGSEMNEEHRPSVWVLTEYRGGCDRNIARTDGGNPRSVFDLLALFVVLRATCGNADYALRIRCYLDPEDHAKRGMANVVEVVSFDNDETWFSP